MKKVQVCAVVLLSASALLAGCSSESEPAESTGLPSDPIAQMEISFSDSPRKDVIRAGMERAFSAVQMTMSDDNLSRAGSVLVSFRKEYGLSEMDILDCMPYRAHDPRVPSLNFGNVAAVCATDLASGVSVP